MKKVCVELYTEDNQRIEVWVNVAGGEDMTKAHLKERAKELAIQSLGFFYWSEGCNL